MKFIRVIKANVEEDLSIGDYIFEADSDCEWYYKIDNKNITINLYEHTHEFNEENGFDDSWDGRWTVEIDSPIATSYLRFDDFDDAKKYILNLIEVLQSKATDEEAISFVSKVPSFGGWR